MNAPDLSAAAAAELVAAGRLRSEDLVRGCLDRVANREDEVRAWQVLDPAHAVAQARACDAAAAAGRALGPLHGVPVGIKDIFDTSDMPTEYGSPIFAGNQPQRDAMAVSLLRRAGAVIMGKTVTTEFAARTPGKTCNPCDPARTPGGSSSGSAAAVADGMVPLAIGTQTVGSTIRPASFCGVVGFKPTHGLISRTGMYAQSGQLDHVGLFARTVEDVALLAEVLAEYDPADEFMTLAAASPLRAVATSEPPSRPRLAFVRTPYWDRVEAATAAGFGELLAALGDGIEEVGLPGEFEDCLAHHFALLEVDMAISLAGPYERACDHLGPTTREMIERGHGRTALEYLRAQNEARRYRRYFDELFAGYDAIVTPATAGEAPIGLANTGDPSFCSIWTLCGLPAITLPLLEGDNGLPIGVQLVGPRRGDAALLRTARWLANSLGD